ncbi:MAG: replication initiator protein [Microvirus sp.]|nr:MAG: replication initiator protein [Microvirus sp.]
MPCHSPGHSRSGQVVSCGYCKFCRLKYAGEWAVRCMHEASLYTENSFITLTYDDKRLPPGYDIRQGLIYSHFQVDFLKALRDRCGGLTKVKHHNFGKFNSRTNEPYPEFHRPIRFYMSGEYGTLRARPHWHACLFNFDFSDRYLWRYRRFPNGSKYPVYRSPLLEELWPYGNSEIGSVTFQSAGYCARYIMSKVVGDDDRKSSAYDLVDSSTGEVFIRRPEFSKMSLRPGIGEGWFRKFSSDVFPVDHVVLANGREVKPPRYYDKRFFAMNKEYLVRNFNPETGEVIADFHSPELDNIKFARSLAVKLKLDNVNRPSLLSEAQVLDACTVSLKRIL